MGTALPLMATTLLPDEAGEWFGVLAATRRTTRPKRLGSPGPDAGQRRLILEAAAAAPDHGELLPWRFIEVPDALRSALAQAFERALLERDPQAGAEDLERAREKAHRAPWLMLAVVRTSGPAPEIPAAERLLSAGCAIQNLLLAATAMGHGSALTSGRSLASPVLRRFFGLSDDEVPVCFVSIGTVLRSRPARARPAAERFHSVLRVPPADA